VQRHPAHRGGRRGGWFAVACQQGRQLLRRRLEHGFLHRCPTAVEQAVEPFACLAFGHRPVFGLLLHRVAQPGERLEQIRHPLRTGGTRAASWNRFVSSATTPARPPADSSPPGNRVRLNLGQRVREGGGQCAQPCAFAARIASPIRKIGVAIPEKRLRRQRRRRGRVGPGMSSTR